MLLNATFNEIYAIPENTAHACQSGFNMFIVISQSANFGHYTDTQFGDLF